MTPPRYAMQKGFTLLELIIAMTLAALIVALGAAILRMGMDFYQRSHAYIHQQQEVRGFLKLLRDELQGASPGTLMLAGEPFRLNFATDNMPSGAGRGGQNNVVLECRDNGQGKADLVHRILLKKEMEEKRKKTDEIAKPGAAKPEAAKEGIVKQEAARPETMLPEYEEEILVRQLSQCAFSFLARSDQDGKVKAVWIDKWPAAGGLPLAVRVRLTPPGGNLPPVVMPLNP